MEDPMGRNYPNKPHMAIQEAILIEEEITSKQVSALTSIERRAILLYVNIDIIILDEAST